MKPEYYEFRDGRTLVDDPNVDKMYIIVKEAPEQSRNDGTGYEWSELGLSRLFGKVFRENCRYCAAYKSWFVYTGGVWKQDVDNVLISGQIKLFIRLLALYCSEIEDPVVSKKYSEFINKFNNRNYRDKLMKDSMEELLINSEDFDSNPYLINCQNGTYNLKDSTFYEHDPKDLITMQTNFKHTVNRYVTSERWLKFIDEITEGDTEKAEYLQKALGYSIFGINTEECMFLLHGKTTRNGKSTLLNTIEYMLGDYSKVAPVGIICKNSKKRDVESASPVLASLKGRRFITMSESNEYGELDEEVIKQLTGGEKITARDLHKSAMSYTPQFTMFLSCNDLPTVSDKSLFHSERLRVIEFNRHFSQDEQDKNLKRTLCSQENMKGIFMWLIRGYRKYLLYGLKTPDKLKYAVEKYEYDNDSVLQFLENKCESKEDASIKCSELYRSFKSWCRSEGINIITARKFHSEMERHSNFFERKSISHGYPVYLGIQLRQII